MFEERGSPSPRNQRAFTVAARIAERDGKHLPRARRLPTRASRMEAASTRRHPRPLNGLSDDPEVRLNTLSRSPTFAEPGECRSRWSGVSAASVLARTATSSSPEHGSCKTRS